MAAESFAGVTVARILRPWGRRGEVAAEILTDFPQRLSALREVWLVRGSEAPRRTALLFCRLHLGQAVFHFAGSESINDAELLRGLLVQVPAGERVALADPARHYISDLIGCQVWEENAAAPLGAVEDVLGHGVPAGRRMPESWRLVVATPQGELLIPLVSEICTRVDTAARRIEVRLPPGLRELNKKSQRDSSLRSE